MLAALASFNVFASGGVTFDFAKISEARFHVPLAGETGNLADATPFVETASNHAPWTVKALSRFVDLPDASGGDYRASFNYRMSHPGAAVHGGDVMFTYYRRDARGKRVPLGVKVYTLGDGTFHLWKLEDTGARWMPFLATLPIPAGAESVEYIVRVHDGGTVEAKDPGLVRAPTPRPVTLDLGAMSLLDGRFALAQNQAGLLCCEWKATDKKRRWDFSKFLFTLRLPTGVEFIDAVIADQRTVRLESNPDGSSIVTFVPREGLIEIDPGKIWLHRQFGILLRSARPAGTELGRFGVSLAYDGEMIADPVSLDLFTVETIRTERPTRYMNGIHPGKYQASFEKPGADAAFAAAVVAAGAQMADVRGEAVTAERLSVWRAGGIKFILPQAFAIFQNAYWWDDGKNAPPEDKFVPKGDLGRFANYIGKYGLCPKAIIERRPFFMTNIVPRIRRLIAGGDGTSVNWEPGMFRGRGCFCEKCSAELAAFKGTPEEYRSREHAKMVRVIDEIVREATGGERSAGFVPDITWREVNSMWRANDPSPETRPIDYAGDLKWILPWGPYYGWDAGTPYLYQKRGPVIHFVAAKDVREQVNADYPLLKRPKLIAFPNGIQYRWLGQPEWIEMALDSYFFNGWEATAPYFFPDSYDARYWAAFARATGRAAKYERFVWDGTRVDGSVALKPVPEYAAPCKTVTAYLPKVTDVSPLLHAAYELDGTRIVAVFNFWEKGDAFFDLKAMELSGDYAIISGRRVVAKADGSRFHSAAELAAGVRLTVGAARTRVFELVPADRADASLPVVTTAQIAAKYEAQRPALAMAAAEDAAEESASGGAKKNTTMEF